MAGIEGSNRMKATDQASATAGLTLRAELAALEAARGQQHDPGVLAAKAAERRRQVVAFDPAALPGPGRPMPDGAVTDITDTPTTLHATRDGRPAVVVFYRGGWCPYCNLALRTYERDVVPVVRSRGATFIAISADDPDGSLTWDELTYDVLADPNHVIARQLGIMATPPADDADVDSWRAALGAPPAPPPEDPGLPLPATVLVDAGGLIRWIDVHPDHYTRTEPAAIIQALDLVVPLDATDNATPANIGSERRP
jgi:peroxiredoxin